MADAKIINYGQQISAGSTAIPDNTSNALDIESTDAQDYITADTTDGSESITLSQQTKITGGGGTTGLAMPTGDDAPTLYLENSTGSSQNRTALMMNTDGPVGCVIDMYVGDDRKMLIQAQSGSQSIVAEDTLFFKSDPSGGARASISASSFDIQDLNTFVITNNASDATAKALAFTRSRNATDGNATIVQDNDVLGRIDWYGADASSGTTADNQTIAASIYAQIDGTPGHEDMPGSIRMATTPDDTAALSDRLVIRRNGNIGLGDTEPNYRVVIGGSISTPIQYNYNSNTSAMSSAMTATPNGAAGGIFDHKTGDSLYLMNTTSENIADGRETGIAFFGRTDEASDEYPMMGAIRVKHEGTAADQKGYMAFYTNDGDDDRVPQERMRIDSSGRVGLARNPADYWSLADDLVLGTASATGITIVGGTHQTLSLATGSSGAEAYQNVIQGTGAAAGDGIRFITNGTSTECIRITTAGNILCPQLDASSDVQTDGDKNLTTSSDMRLKNPIAELGAGLDKINQLVPRFFSWKNDQENKSQLGFFSQEVHSVCPEAAPKSPKMVPVSTELGEDNVNVCDKEKVQALDADGNLDFNWSLNSRAIVALLVKSVQELSAKVTALEEAQGN